jgi:hypothetical protein
MVPSFQKLSQKIDVALFITSFAVQEKRQSGRVSGLIHFPVCNFNNFKRNLLQQLSSCLISHHACVLHRRRKKNFL